MSYDVQIMKDIGCKFLSEMKSLAYEKEKNRDGVN